MSSWRDLGAPALAALLAAGSAAAAPAYDGIGRPATGPEIAAWNIDVRPDFQGLPKGSGSVAQGQVVWEGKCASCHGIFGESRDVFTPIVGGTTAEDMKTGHAARLQDPTYPGRTAMMKLSTLSTLWDFISRAMPWTAPKSLSHDEVYAVVAYILNLANVVPQDFTLSDRNIAEVQQRLPNRNGMTTKHALWPGRDLGGTDRPDVQGSSCMKDCAVEPRIASSLPDFARNANGNLAQQNRLVGAQLGADTSRPAATAAPGSAAPRAAAQAAARGTEPAAPHGNGVALLKSHGCVACHGIASRIVGPALRDVANKVAGRADAVPYLVGRIRSGGSGTWGSVPMPPQTLSDADATAIAQWIAAGAQP